MTTSTSQAVTGVRFGMTPHERLDAVATIVQRRRRASVRVREEGVSTAGGSR